MKQSSRPKAFARNALLFVTLPCFTSAQVSTGRPQHILTDQFTILTSVSTIPDRVLDRFRQLTKNDGVLLAEPGAYFQVTDVIVNSELPGRRLIFAGASKEYCFIHYEMGGIAHTYFVILFRLAGDGATFEWGARSDHAFRDLGELRKAIAEKRLSENPRGWW